MKSWMIYGANGYTGKLVAKQAKKLAMRPVLAGRNEAAIKKLARELDLPFAIFPCENADEIAEQIKDIDIILHCAGPFSSTAKPMGIACLKAKTHYLDITGEIKVFESFLNRSERYKEAGVIAIPGVGFDVVPSDCLAAKLKNSLPDANDLELYLKPSQAMSPGTLKTMVEGFYIGSVIRKNGEITVVEDVSAKEINFAGKTMLGKVIPWGDISTAFHSTGIPNIKVYLISHPKNIKQMQFLNKIRFFLKLSLVQALLKALITKYMKGPSEEVLQKSHYRIWAKVTNAKGESKEAGIKTTNGYDFTVHSAIAIVKRLQEAELAPGAWTPSKAFGADFVDSITGVEKF